MERSEFIPSRQKLWDELSVLANIAVKTEGQRADECIKSREFWQWGPVEHKLKYPAHPWLAEGLTDIQRRIIYTVRTGVSV